MLADHLATDFGHGGTLEESSAAHKRLKPRRDVRLDAEGGTERQRTLMISEEQRLGQPRPLDGNNKERECVPGAARGECPRQRHGATVATTTRSRGETETDAYTPRAGQPHKRKERSSTRKPWSAMVGGSWTFHEDRARRARTRRLTMRRADPQRVEEERTHSV